MLRLLQYLIYGHVHSWDIHEEVRMSIKDETMNGNYIKGPKQTKSAIYTRYILRCKHCGQIKINDDGAELK